MMSNAQALLTLPLFMAWVKEQPPNREFDYNDIRHCSVAQYLKAKGMINPNVGHTTANVGDYNPRDGRECLQVPVAIQDVMSELFDNYNRRTATFGELAERLEKANGQDIPVA